MSLNMIIKKLNVIVLGWSNYFLPSPNQYMLRKSLDHYVFKRSMKWLYKKHAASGYARAVRDYLMHKEPNSGKLV